MARVRQPVNVQPVSFERSADAVLGDLRDALAALVAALPGRNLRAVDLQRTLGLDRKLGWQLFNFVTAPKPVEAIASLPGAPSIKRILLAATKKGAPRAAAERVAHAFDVFEAFVAEHGGDREELVSLTRGLSADIDQQHELRVRKSVFRGLAHLWGIRAAAVARTAIIHPSTHGPEGSDDVLVVVGFVGVQRLRWGAPFALSATVGVSGDPEDGTRRVLRGAPGQPPIGPLEILQEFSSKPLPEMVERTDSNGEIETELQFPPSSRAGAMTLFTAQRISEAWAGLQSLHGLNSLVKIPTESFVCELLVPTGWTDPGTAHVGVYGRRGAVERVDHLRAGDLFPQRETISSITNIAAPPVLPEAPLHHEAVGAMLRRVGWTDTRYDLYRCVVQFPVLHTMIRIAAHVAKPQ